MQQKRTTPRADRTRPPSLNPIQIPSASEPQRVSSPLSPQKRKTERDRLYDFRRLLTYTIGAWYDTDDDGRVLPKVCPEDLRPLQSVISVSDFIDLRSGDSPDGAMWKTTVFTAPLSSSERGIAQEVTHGTLDASIPLALRPVSYQNSLMKNLEDRQQAARDQNRQTLKEEIEKIAFASPRSRMRSASEDCISTAAADAAVATVAAAAATAITNGDTRNHHRNYQQQQQQQPLPGTETAAAAASAAGHNGKASSGSRKDRKKSSGKNHDSSATPVLLLLSSKTNTATLPSVFGKVPEPVINGNHATRSLINTWFETGRSFQDIPLFSPKPRRSSFAEQRSASGSSGLSSILDQMQQRRMLADQEPPLEWREHHQRSFVRHYSGAVETPLIEKLEAIQKMAIKLFAVQALHQPQHQESAVLLEKLKDTIQLAELYVKHECASKRFARDLLLAPLKMFEGMPLMLMGTQVPLFTSISLVEQISPKGMKYKVPIAGKADLIYYDTFEKCYVIAGLKSAPLDLSPYYGSDSDLSAPMLETKFLKRKYVMELHVYAMMFEHICNQLGCDTVGDDVRVGYVLLAGYDPNNSSKFAVWRFQFDPEFYLASDFSNCLTKFYRPGPVPSSSDSMLSGRSDTIPSMRFASNHTGCSVRYPEGQGVPPLQRPLFTKEDLYELLPHRAINGLRR